MQKTVRYHGEFKELASMFNQLSSGNTFGQDLICHKVSDNYYTIEHPDSEPIHFYYNLILFRVHFEDMVRVHAHIIQKNDHLQLIECHGKFRKMIIGILGFYLFLILIQIYATKDGLSLGGWGILTILFILLLIIANKFWSGKEQYLVTELKKALLLQMRIKK